MAPPAPAAPSVGAPPAPVPAVASGKRKVTVVDSSVIFKMKSVVIDGRLSLGVLKEKISEIVGVSTGEFKIKRSQYGSELKDVEESLLKLLIRDGDDVWIERGTPLKVGERLFRIYAHTSSSEPSSPNEEKSDGFTAPAPTATYLGDVTLNQEWDMARIRKEIHTLFSPAYPSVVPDPKHMRVRERGGRQKVYVDGTPLRNNAAGQADNKELLIQRTVEEEYLTTAHVLINIYRWHPVKRSLDAPMELAFLKDMKMEEFCVKLRTLVQVGQGAIMLAKARLYQIKDPNAVAALEWKASTLKADGSIGESPWNFM